MAESIHSLETLDKEIIYILETLNRPLEVRKDDNFTGRDVTWQVPFDYQS